MAVELDGREFRKLLAALQAPKLRAFAVAAAELGGFVPAIETCRTRTLDDKLRKTFDRCAWTIDDLPAAEVMEAIILGVRLVTAASGEKQKLRSAARVLKISYEQADAAIAALEEWTEKRALT